MAIIFLAGLIGGVVIVSGFVHLGDQQAPSRRPPLAYAM